MILFPNRNTQHPSEIPDGWMVCDGYEITEGVWAISVCQKDFFDGLMLLML